MKINKASGAEITELRRELAVQKRCAETKVEEMKLGMMEQKKVIDEQTKVIDKQTTAIDEQTKLIEGTKKTQKRFALTPATHACMYACMHNNIHAPRLRKELAVQKRSKTRANSKLKALKRNMTEQKKVIDKQFTVQQHFTEAQQRFALLPATHAHT